MTCIVAVVEDGAVWMGSDSYVGHPRNIIGEGEHKVYIKHHKDGTPWIFGCLGHPRPSQVFEYALELPELSKNATIEEMMRVLVLDFTKNMRQCLAENDCLEQQKDGLPGFLGNLVLGVHGQLFVATENLSIRHIAQTYHAHGQGEEAAFIALSMLSAEKPKKRLTRALKAAERVSPYILPPYHILHT